MTQTPDQDGIIGFFDILGYLSFLKKNTTSAATEEVLNTLSNLNSLVRDQLSSWDELEPIRDIIDSIKWLIFSDTILIYTHFPFNEPRESQYFRWSAFLSICMVLNRHMFEFGLPLRGAINSGKFRVQGSCFTGMPIVEAYQLTQQLDIALSVITPAAYQTFVSYPDTLGFKNSYQMFGSAYPEYPLPCKKCDTRTMHVLNFLAVRTFRSLPVNPDLRQYVLDSFWRHNKEITGSGYRMAMHTETFFRYVVHKFPGIIKSRIQGTKSLPLE